MYGLDPCHYYTLPSYSDDCMFKMTEVKIELLINIDMRLFYEASIRGGISMIGGMRYAAANNIILFIIYVSV